MPQFVTRGNSIELLYPKICIKTIYFVNITSEHIASLLSVLVFKYKHSTQCKRNIEEDASMQSRDRFVYINQTAREWVGQI